MILLVTLANSGNTSLVQRLEMKISKRLEDLFIQFTFMLGCTPYPFHISRYGITATGSVNLHCILTPLFKIFQKYYRYL